jgi:hypothetical protein
VKISGESRDRQRMFGLLVYNSQLVRGLRRRPHQVSPQPIFVHRRKSGSHTFDKFPKNSTRATHARHGAACARTRKRRSTTAPAPIAWPHARLCVCQV